ncbi:MAG: DUF1700 domain-containing protein [Clostridiales bacterium]|nr:DUF1700 domain-containing protein [Clostridiales bacterium]
MVKTEYLKKLEAELGLMSYKDVKDILSEISDHFDEGVRMGHTEEEIAENLGSPVDLAKAYKEGTSPLLPTAPRKRASEYTNVKREQDPAAGKIFVVIFNIFVAIPLWIALFFIILAAVGIFAGGIAGLVAFCLAIPTFGAYMTPCIFLAVTLGLILIVLFVICFFAVKYFIKGTSAYIKWNKKLWREGF